MPTTILTLVAHNHETLDLEEWANWWEKAGGWQLRQILYWRWDPIGVQGGFPWSRGEYDGFAGQVAKRLREGCGYNELALELGQYENDMGLSAGPKDELAKVAKFICEWYPASVEHWRTSA